MDNASQLIKLVRKARGLTQVQLSESTKINYRHLQDIESGKTDVKLSTIDKIARAIRIPVCAFFKEPKNQVDLKCLLLFGCTGEVLDHMPIGIQLSTTDNTIVYVNHYFAKHFSIFGRREDVVGRKLSDLLYHEEDGESARRYARIILKELPKPTRYLTIVRGPRSQPINVMIDWQYQYNDQGEVVGFSSIIQRNLGIPLKDVTLSPSISGQSI